MEILKSRGCIIADEDFCLKTLQSINYYRLSAYFLPFKNSDNTFKINTTFERIANIYNFDKELRIFLFSVIEDIEIFVLNLLIFTLINMDVPLILMETFSQKNTIAKNLMI